MQTSLSAFSIFSAVWKFALEKNAMKEKINIYREIGPSEDILEITYPGTVG